MDVKGTAVESLPRFIRDKHGDLGLTKWLEALPAATRGVMAVPILPSKWFPLEQFLVEPTVKLCELYFGGSMRGAVEVGKYSADIGLRGIYKMFVKLGSTDFLIRKASTILPTYYRPSAMKVVEKGSGETTVRITEFEVPSEVVEQRMLGWMQRALEISGARNVTVTLSQTMTKGAPYTDFVLKWKE